MENLLTLKEMKNFFIIYILIMTGMKSIFN